MKSGLPARDAIVETFERFANVGFALRVDVEVVVKLIGEGGEILKLAVEPLGACGGMSAGYEPLNGVGVLIEVLDVKADADDGGRCRPRRPRPAGPESAAPGFSFLRVIVARSRRDETASSETATSVAAASEV